MERFEAQGGEAAIPEEQKGESQAEGEEEKEGAQAGTYLKEEEIENYA